MSIIEENLPPPGGTAALKAMRAQIASEVEDFLARGGIIVKVDAGVSGLNELVEKFETSLSSPQHSARRIKNRSKVFAIHDMDAYFNANNKKGV